MADSDIRCGPLRVTWHEEPLRIELENDGARLTLTPEPPTAGGAWIVGRGRIKGRAGPAQRLELQHPGGDTPGVRVVIEVPEDGTGIVVELRPERGGGPASLALHPATLGAEGPRSLEGQGFRSRRLSGLLTRLDPGSPPAASPAPGTGLCVAAPPGQDSPGRLWIGIGVAGADLEASAVARVAAEREVTPPGRGAVTGPGASDLGHAPVGVVGPADEAPSDGAWRVGQGTPRSADIGRVEAWEPPDPLRRLAGAGRLWQLAFRLDPGADPDELRTCASLAGLAGGLAHIEAPRPVSDEARAILRRCLPPLARSPRLAASGVLLTPLIGARVAVALWNDGDGPWGPIATWAQLGLAGPHHAFDFWDERDLGLLEGSLSTAPLEPGRCRVIALTAPANRPQVVGTTLHLGMGTVEVAALRQEAAGRRLALRLPGAHRGRVFVAEPDGGRVEAHDVAFEDATELQLSMHAPGPGS
jgi:hypothetical protein